MCSLKKILKKKLTESEHLRSTNEALPRDPVAAAEISSVWEHDWVKEAFHEKTSYSGTESKTDTNEGPRRIAEQKAMKDLSMKHYFMLFELTLFKEGCRLSNVQIIKYFLFRNSSHSSDHQEYLISFRGYQNFLAELSTYFLFSNTSNCLWILSWFSTELFMKLCIPEVDACVPVSMLLEYFDRKLNFYNYRVEQLELGRKEMLSSENIKVSLAYVNKLNSLSSD